MGSYRQKPYLALPRPGGWGGLGPQLMSISTNDSPVEALKHSHVENGSSLCKGLVWIRTWEAWEPKKMFCSTVSSLWMVFPLTCRVCVSKLAIPHKISQNTVLSVLSSFFPLELLFLGCMPHFQHRQTQQIQMGLGQKWTPKNNPPNTSPSIPLWPSRQTPRGPRCFVLRGRIGSATNSYS